MTLARAPLLASIFFASASAARAGDAPVGESSAAPGTGVFLDGRLATVSGSYVVDSVNDRTPMFGVGVGAGAGFRCGPVALGVEGEVAHDMMILIASGDLGTRAVFAGFSFPLGLGALELRVRGGSHRFFHLEDSLFGGDPSPNRADLAFGGLGGRFYVPVHRGTVAVRVFGGAQFDVDFSSRDIPSVGRGSIQVGGAVFSMQVGAELSIW